VNIDEVGSLAMERRRPKERPEVTAWKTKYQQLDDSTLLSLLPVLDQVIEQATTCLEMASEAERGVSAQSDDATKYLADAMALRDKGVDVSGFVAQVEELADGATASAPRMAAHTMQALGYASDLVLRKKWILDVELCRRGLLPDLADFPCSDPPGQASR
jgi:hypothetical protein